MSVSLLRSWTPSWVRQAARIATQEQARVNTLHDWRRRIRGEPAIPPGARRVVVLCHGNICRSPFAGLLLAARTDFEVITAGLEAREGDPAQPGALRTAPRFQIDLADHQAHKLVAEDIDWADWLLGMEGHHVARMISRFPEAAAKAGSLGDFVPKAPYLISDPWGQSDEVFEETFSLIEQAVARVAAVSKDAS